MGSILSATIMNGLLVTICFILFRLSSALPQRGGGSDPVDLDNLQFSGPSFNFNCPEPNGLFADKEQCDLYYHCEDGRSTSILCPDGFLFDDSIRNHEKCVLPHNVDCGKREFVQARQEDPSVCNIFYNCDNGTVHEMTCPDTLIFDVG